MVILKITVSIILIMDLYTKVSLFKVKNTEKVLCFYLIKRKSEESGIKINLLLTKYTK